MRLSRTPHPLSAQGKFEKYMMHNGWLLGALAINGDRYCNDEVQSAWRDWLGDWLGEPFDGKDADWAYSPFDNARWDNEDDGRAVVADWESEE